MLTLADMILDDKTIIEKKLEMKVELKSKPKVRLRVFQKVLSLL